VRSYSLKATVNFLMSVRPSARVPSERGELIFNDFSKLGSRLKFVENLTIMAGTVLEDLRALYLRTYGHCT
jgi:hypothetical protein